MNILKWVFQILDKNERYQSAVEEHNRYLRPPYGVEVKDWFKQIARAKYGDMLSGAVWKGKHNGKEDA